MLVSDKNMGWICMCSPWPDLLSGPGEPIRMSSSSLSTSVMERPGVVPRDVVRPREVDATDEARLVARLDARDWERVVIEKPPALEAAEPALCLARAMRRPAPVPLAMAALRAVSIAVRSSVTPVPLILQDFFLPLHSSHDTRVPSDLGGKLVVHVIVSEVQRSHGIA